MNRRILTLDESGREGVVPLTIVQYEGPQGTQSIALIPNGIFRFTNGNEQMNIAIFVAPIDDMIAFSEDGEDWTGLDTGDLIVIKPNSTFLLRVLLGDMGVIINPMPESPPEFISPFILVN